MNRGDEHDKKTLTRNDLAERLVSEVGAMSDAYKFVGVFFETLAEAIAEDGKVNIHGFGRFHCIDKKERIGRNPKTGEESVITARRVVSFVASGKLRRTVTEERERAAMRHGDL